MSPKELLEQVSAAYGEEEFMDVATEAILTLFRHHKDFHRMARVPISEIWDTDAIKKTCFEIGELVYQEGDMEYLSNIYYELRETMGLAARYLEHYWNGVGDGAWRS